MNEWIVTIEKVVAILGFGGAIFSYVVIRPLNAAILRLQESIDKLSDELKSHGSKLHSLEIRITEVDNRAKSNSHRIDKIETYLTKGGASP